MRICAADAERADARAQRLAIGAQPRSELIVDEERSAVEVDARIRLVEVQTRRQHAMLEREDCLDQAGHARRRIEMPNIGLDRPERAEPTPFRVGAKSL